MSRPPPDLSDARILRLPPSAAALFPRPAVSPPLRRRTRSRPRPHQHHGPRPLPPRRPALSIFALPVPPPACRQASSPHTSSPSPTSSSTRPSSIPARRPPSGKPTYDQGRFSTGALGREGERVRLAVRDCVESARELVEGRNPIVVERGPEDEEQVKVGVTGEGEFGDRWQEFWWRYRASEVDVELPASHLPILDRSSLQQATASLVNLVQLFLTSPALQALVTDLVLPIRDTADIVLETAQAKDQVGPATVDALERVVEVAAEGAVGASTVKAHDKDPAAMSSRPGKGEGKEEARAAGAGPDEAQDPPEVRASLAPLLDDEVLASTRSTRRGDDSGGDEVSAQVEEKEPQQLQDEFVDRVKKIFIQLQAQPQYQRSMQTLLTLAAAASTTSSSPSSPVPAHPAPTDGDDPTHMLLPLLEPFTGGPGSLIPLRRAPHTLLLHLDPSCTGTSPASRRDLAHSLDALVEKALLEPRWVGGAAAQRQVAELHDSMHPLARDYPVLAQHVLRVFACVAAAMQVLAGDELLARAARALEELAGAVGARTVEAAGTAARAVTGAGVAAVWGDVADWLEPRVLGVLKEIPLPRFEFASPTVSLAIDPPSLLATSIIPSSISLQQSTSITLAPGQRFPRTGPRRRTDVWLLRPLLCVAVRKAVEYDVCEPALEPGAEWVGRLGFEARERAEELRARAADAAQEGQERIQSQMERVWRWARAAWDVLAGRAVDEEEGSVHESRSDPSNATSGADRDAHPAWHLHLNRHGVAVDLEAANGIVGIGSEGVVLPTGEAPLPESRSPPKGLARAARDEVRHEVDAGREAAEGRMRAVGEVGEEADRWDERVRKEQRTRPHSWRSAAFDLKRART